MKTYSLNLQQLVFCLVLLLFGKSVACGQTYKPGDLYAFDDGSKGIVFYVDPDDPTRGTVVALNDLEGQYALWTGGRPQALDGVFAPSGNLSIRSISNWEGHGKRSTRLLAESGVSPAASALDVAAGWYIPDAMQLYLLYANAVPLSDAFVSHGGEIMSLWTSAHWTSTYVRNSTVNAYAISSSLKLNALSGNTPQYIRPVRDFPDTAVLQVFWTDTHSQADTLVSPAVTTTYDAVVVYRSDTLPLAATVTVHQPAADTLFETVNTSPQPYTSSVAPVLTALDISLPGSYEYNDTLQTVYGCDSIVTLLLKVEANVRYSDTLCSLKEDYYFAPFDTVFAVGTVAGVYEHHGIKMVDGVPIDTVAYYDLTILPVYEVFDTISWCLYELSETRQYDGNEHVTVTVNGTTVSVASTSEEVVVEEMTPNIDFALWMQTIAGCDSVVFLHVEARRVLRDTVFVDVSVTQLTDGQLTAVCHTFTDIDGPGTYWVTDGDEWLRQHRGL